MVALSLGHTCVVSFHSVTEEGPVTGGDPRWSRARVHDFDARYPSVWRTWYSTLRVTYVWRAGVINADDSVSRICSY